MAEDKKKEKDSDLYLQIDAARAFLRQMDKIDQSYADRAVEIMGIGAMKFFKKVKLIL